MTCGGPVKLLLSSLFLLTNLGQEIVGQQPGYGGGKTPKPTATTSGYAAESTTTKFPLKCHAPNQTEDDGCGCYQTCEGYQLCQTCMPGHPAQCLCSEGYVLDGAKCILAKDCPCPGPNQEFTICSSVCEKNCTYPDPPCTENCGPPKCECKQGFVNESGVCIDRNSCPSTGCHVEIASTTTPSATTDFDGGHYCLEGNGTFGDCTRSANLTKCLEEQKVLEKRVFKPVRCGPGSDFRCLSIRHNCGIADAEYRAKFCYAGNETVGTFCDRKRSELCPFEHTDQCGQCFRCNLCEGMLCNRAGG